MVNKDSRGRVILKVFTPELMEPYFQALEKCRGVAQEDFHHPEGDVFTHTLQVLARAFKETNDTDLILAAMLHDVGKSIESHGHEQIAVEMLDEYISAKTKWLIEQHMRIRILLKGEMKKLSKVQELVEHPFLPDLILLTRWDKMGRNPNKVIKYDKEDIINKLNKCVKRRFEVNHEN